MHILYLIQKDQSLAAKQREADYYVFNTEQDFWQLKESTNNEK